MSKKFIYNHALDLMAAALEATKAGKPVQAAKLLTAASVCPSSVKALAIIESSNSRAHAALAAAAAKKPAVVKSAAKTNPLTRLKAGRRVTASDDGVEPCNAGEEFRVEPDENGDRIVQEADLFDVEDLDDEVESSDLGFLDEDAGPIESAADDEDDVEEDDEDDEDDDLVESIFKASVKPVKAASKPAPAKKPVAAAKTQTSVSAAALQRAMKNAVALAQLEK